MYIVFSVSDIRFEFKVILSIMRTVAKMDASDYVKGAAAKKGKDGL